MNRKKNWAEKRLAVCRKRFEAASYDHEAGRNLAVALVDVGRSGEAEKLVRELLDSRPSEAESWAILAFTLRNRPGSGPEREMVLRQAISLDPAFSWAARELATQLEASGRAEEAEEILRRDLEGKPEEAETLYALGLLLGRQGRFREELECLRKALDLRPALSSAARALSAGLAGEGRLAEAVETMTAQIERDTLDSENLVELARLKETEGQHREAERLFRHAVDQDPFTAGPRCALAWFLAGRKRFDEALELLTRAIEEDGREAEYFSYRGRIREEMKDLEGARRDFLRAVECAPEGGWARRELWLVKIAMGEVEEAAREARQVSCGPQVDVEDLGVLAQAFLEMGRKEAAEEVLRQALSRDPYYSWAVRELARLLAEREDPKGAEEILRQRIDRGRPEPMDLGLLAEFLQERGSHRAAEQCLRQGLGLDPCNGWLRRELALLLGERGELGSAEELLLDRVRSERVEAFDYGVMGWIKDRQGRIEEALAWHREALRLDPTYSFSLDRAVDLLVKQERAVEAEQLLRRSLEVEPQEVSLLVRLAEVLMVREQWQELERVLRLVLELDPSSTWSTCKLAEITAARGEREEAVTILRQALDENQLDPFLWAQLAVLELPRDPVAAERAALISLREDEDNEDAAQVLLAALLEQGRTGEARSRAEELTDRFPGKVWPHIYHYRALHQEGRHAQAEERARELVGALPGDPCGWAMLAEALLAQDKEEEVLRLLDEMPPGLAAEDDLLLMRGRAEQRLKRWARAEEAFRRAVLVGQGGEAVRLHLAEVLERHPDRREEALTLVREVVHQLDRAQDLARAARLLGRLGHQEEASRLLLDSEEDSLRAWGAVFGLGRAPQELDRAEAVLEGLPATVPEVILARALVTSRRGRRLEAGRLVRQACRAGLTVAPEWFRREWLPLRLLLRLFRR